MKWREREGRRESGGTNQREGGRKREGRGVGMIERGKGEMERWRDGEMNESLGGSRARF